MPFAIGESAFRAGAQAALVIGPPADSPLAARLAEFSHAVSHVLEAGDVAPGWVPFNGTMSPYTCLRAHLDFMASRG